MNKHPPEIEDFPFLYLMLRYDFRDGPNWKEWHEEIQDLRADAEEEWHIPQTVGDQIWRVFRFKNKHDKFLFIKQLPTKYIPLLETPQEYVKNYLYE